MVRGEPIEPVGHVVTHYLVELSPKVLGFTGQVSTQSLVDGSL